jgi:hypothetical protein
MSKFFATRQLMTLRPLDDDGFEALRHLPEGKILTVEVKQPRNAKHARKFWKLADVVHHNLSDEQTLRYPQTDDLVDAFKVLLGYSKEIHLPGGEVFKKPGSIAFHKMDQTEFNVFYDKVCDLIAKYFLPGIETVDLKQEVESLIGVAA